MAYERFANGGISALVSSIDGTATALTIQSSGGFPTSANFRIRVEDEIMKVTNVAANTFTVARGQEGTTAASHSADATVVHVLTAAAIAGQDADQFTVDSLTNRDAAGIAGRLFLPSSGYLMQDNGSAWDTMPFWRMTPPDPTDFTWVNQGTSTVSDTKGMMVLKPQAVASGDNLRMLVKSAPSTPYEITVCFLAQDPEIHSGYVGQYGICWRNNTTGALITFGCGYKTTSSHYMNEVWHTRWTDHDTVSSQVSYRPLPQMFPLWMRFGDDGTDRYAKVSCDGISFQLVDDAESNTTFTTPDQVGVFANSFLSSVSPKRIVSFLNWSES